MPNSPNQTCEICGDKLDAREIKAKASYGDDHPWACAECYEPDYDPDVDVFG